MQRFAREGKALAEDAMHCPVSATWTVAACWPQLLQGKMPLCMFQSWMIMIIMTCRLFPCWLVVPLLSQPQRVAHGPPEARRLQDALF